MSFSLPLTNLATMEISFKVSLPDGLFSFEMAPSPTSESAADTASSATAAGKLHFSTSQDFSGVTLTLFTSAGSATGRPSLDVAPPSNSAGMINDGSGQISGGSVANAKHSSPPFEGHVQRYCESSPAEPSLLDENPGQLRLLHNFMDSLNCGCAATPIHTALSESSDSASPEGSSWIQEFGTSPEPPSIPANLISRTVTASPPAGKSRSANANLPHRPPRPRIRTHSGAKSKFPCTLGCSVDFSRKHDRLRHEVAQHGRTCEWECRACFGFFSSEGRFEKHRCKFEPPAMTVVRAGAERGVSETREASGVWIRRSDWC